MDPQDRKQALKEDVLRLGTHAALMRELLHSPAWACYQEYMEQMLSDATERALQRGADAFEKGVVAGLRDALRAPHNVIAWAEQAHRN